MVNVKRLKSNGTYLQKNRIIWLLIWKYSNELINYWSNKRLEAIHFEIIIFALIREPHFDCIAKSAPNHFQYRAIVHRRGAVTVGENPVSIEYRCVFDKSNKAITLWLIFQLFVACLSLMFSKSFSISFKRSSNAD